MIVLVWFHLLAAVTWIGGSLFLSVTLVPILKQDPFAAQRGPLFKAAANRFRKVVWGAIAILVLTGIPLLSRRTDSLLSPAGWPPAIQIKLFLVLLLLALTVIHDYWLGPRVGRLLRVPHPSPSPSEARLLRYAPWVARLGLGLGLAVLLAAAAVARS